MSLEPLAPSSPVLKSDFDQGQKTYRIVLAVLIILFCIVLIRRAWICDDAYITFRTVDNFIHGYRLTWNVTERVQAFTNPLWMFVLSLVYFFTHEIYITSLVVSILLAILVLIILARKLAVSTIGAFFALLVLTLSKAYMDYSTSGLENSLSHLLIVAFFAIFFLQNDSIRKFFFLSLVSSLGIFNRMDLALVFAPALVYSFWKVRSQRAFWMGVLGQLPFILWELFAVWYYGFPFPNTAYAKLNTGIPQGEYLQQGLLYLLNSIQFDPLTLASVAGGLAAAWLNKDRRNLWLATGLLAYLAYVVKVGGDFMSGAF
jgi:arabinofuranosyltransferase